jgi:hypothetical protein
MGDCAGDDSGDVLGKLVWDVLGIDDLVGVVGVLLSSATISALIVSIICSCFARCCMLEFAILFLFVSHYCASCFSRVCSLR